MPPQVATKPKTCHFSKHVGGAQFVVYTVLANIVNGRRMSEIRIGVRRLTEMTVYSRDSIARALTALTAKGWLKRYRADESGGRYVADTYVIIGHDEWAETHPGQCPVRKTRTG
jgi:hypothetical protein